MESRKITNQEYIPLGKLELMDSKIFLETKEYRADHLKIISSQGDYSKLVETPELMKKRYIKNVEISREIPMQVEDNDLILELAKKLIIKKNILKIPDSKVKKLLKIYEEENNDLTIITTWLVENVTEYLKSNNEDIRRIIPQITQKDLKFIKSANQFNSYYSINDYIKIISCSYETARKALEKMTKLNLFQKIKQGKKFLYQPTKKLVEINKGGK